MLISSIDPGWSPLFQSWFRHSNICQLQCLRYKCNQQIWTPWPACDSLLTTVREQSNDSSQSPSTQSDCANQIACTWSNTPFGVWIKLSQTICDGKIKTINCFCLKLDSLNFRLWNSDSESVSLRWLVRWLMADKHPWQVILEWSEIKLAIKKASCSTVFRLENIFQSYSSRHTFL